MYVYRRAYLYAFIFVKKRMCIYICIYEDESRRQLSACCLFSSLHLYTNARIDMHTRVGGEQRMGVEGRE